MLECCGSSQTTQTHAVCLQVDHGHYSRTCQQPQVTLPPESPQVPSACAAQLGTDSTLSARLQEKIKAVLTKENVEANRLRLEVDVNDLQGYDAEVHRRYDPRACECCQRCQWPPGRQMNRCTSAAG